MADRAAKVDIGNVAEDVINPATEEKQDDIIEILGGGNNITQVDVAAASLTYIGYAVPGTATSAASWKIFRVDESGGGGDAVILYAAGVTTFTNIWDNRAALAYS